MAIAIVGIYHYRIFCPTDGVFPYSTELNRVVSAGSFGVTVFFVISGFLITTRSLQRWDEPGRIHVGEFFTMRAARILPGMALLLAVLTLLHVLGVPRFTAPADRSVASAIWYAITFRYYDVVGYNNVEGMFSWSPIWSLSVEETFYIVFPFACLLLRRRAIFAAAMLAIVAAGPYLHSTHPFNGLHYSIDALAMGCLAAVVAQKIELSAIAAFVLRWGGVVLGFAGFWDPGPWLASGLELGVAAYLIGSAGHPGRASMLDAPLRFLGRHSYELYLFHLPGILLFSMVASNVGPRTNTIEFVVFFAALSGVAWAVARHVTEPANRYIRHGLKFLRPPRGPAGPDEPSGATVAAMPTAQR